MSRGGVYHFSRMANNPPSPFVKQTFRFYSEWYFFQRSSPPPPQPSTAVHAYEYWSHWHWMSSICKMAPIAKHFCWTSKSGWEYFLNDHYLYRYVPVWELGGWSDYTKMGQLHIYTKTTFLQWHLIVRKSTVPMQEYSGGIQVSVSFFGYPWLPSLMLCIHMLSKLESNTTHLMDDQHPPWSA